MSASVRDDQINVKLKQGERAIIDRAAKSAGLSRSEWARVILLKAAGQCPCCGVETKV